MGPLVVLCKMFILSELNSSGVIAVNHCRVLIFTHFLSLSPFFPFFPSLLLKSKAP